MSGGSKKTSASATTATTATPVNVPTTTFGAFMPEQQQGLLASQLAMGGYGTPESIAGLLAGFNKPVTLPLISTPDQIAGYLAQTGKKPVADAAVSTAKTATDSTKKPRGYDRISPVVRAK